MSDPFIAEVIMFAGNFAPPGWAFCDGQLLNISNNTALFSLVGTIYGGDGEVTFGLPDLRGRVPVHSGNSDGPGLSPRRLGQKGGSEKVTLNQTQIPSHTHNVKCNEDDGESDEPVDSFHAKAGGGETIYAGSGDQDMGATSAAGGSLSHENMPPFLSINFIIALVGTFPSPN